MKYWFFDGSDVTGPFTVKELAQNKSFVETSLVCPENFSDDGDHWHVASAFDELKTLFFQSNPAAVAVNPFDQEMDSLLHERSPLAIDEVPTDGPKLQIPKKPSKPGPIEEYFDHVKEEDLGDILGIPDPNDNSDLDLAHALEKQLAKTSSTRREKLELSADEQTVEELKQAEQTHRVATATEVFATRPPVSAHAPATVVTRPEQTVATDTVPSMPVVQSPTLPVLEATPAPVQPADEPEPTAQTLSQKDEVEDLSPIPAAKPLPAAEEPEQKPALQPKNQGAADPALSAPKVEGNSVRPRLNQTEEMKKLVRQTQQSNAPADHTAQMRVLITLLTLLVIIGGLLLAVLLRPQRNQPPQASAPAAATTIAQQLLPAQPAVLAEPAPAPSTNIFTTPNEEKALALVQNYPLSGNRGSVANYLQRIYQTHLAQGYTQTWAAEPLYKNAYVVKYQLTKTRKEPIIYVFQVDVAQGKLTGALNNIALDLVGKI